MASRSGTPWFPLAPCEILSDTTSETAIDSASARALAEVYWASCSAMRLESSRISVTGWENQRLTARFIRP